jgi:hypothetical protein
MAIIRYTKDANIKYAYLNIFPDQFKTEAEKKKPSWIKNTMDYFSNRAYADYINNKNTFVKNYDLMKGILRMEDFYQEPDVKSFTEVLEKDLHLPAYVKHYSIVTTPINGLVGEITKRPDTYRVKAFDDDSKSEELQFKTELLQEYVVSVAKQKILQKAAMNGEELSEEDLEQLTLEQVKDQLDSYTSVAEKWSNRMLTAAKAEFNIKEKSEETFRDLCISAREFYHIYEDNSKLGFNIKVINPKNEWHLTTPDKKYISDPSGRAEGAYAVGTVEVMELSEIIESCPELTKDEIDHLRTSLEDYGLINARESNLGNPSVKPGIDSIQYDTFDPLVLQTRMILESEMKDNKDDLGDFLGLTSNVSAFGYKYVVTTAYWISKKKIARVTYEDEMGNIQTILVDEHYKSGAIPTEIDVEWGWINQWYQGKKIGPDIYHVKPFKLLDYSPIIGTLYEVKNTEAKSLLDMMKPFQVLYNICLNQMYRLLEKEIGNVARVSLRRIPRVKDGDGQDDIDVWEMEARERGVMFDDDSPENTKSPISNQTVAGNVDLTRTSEIQSRYNLAVALKNECWELVGMSKQRLGNISSSETATATNTAIQQSYSQTEPLFVAHEYVLGQLYQAIIDAAQYIESNKPNSTLSFISSEGESAFIQVNGNDLKFRDLKVFPTNRPEDTQMFNELRALAQPLMQNGGSLYDVIELYSTKSMREMKKVFRELRDQQIAMQERAAQMEEEKLKQEREIAEAQIQEARYEKDKEMANENYQKELDRISKKEVAIIQALGYGQTEGEDTNNNNVFDPMESGKLSNDRDKANKEYSSKMAEMQIKAAEGARKDALEREKLKVARENMKNDEKIAKINASNRKSKK